MKLLFTGDVAFNQTNNTISNPFENLNSILDDVDATVISLDCCFGDPPPAPWNRPHVIAEKRSLNLINTLPNPIINLATNHTFDCGEEAFIENLSKFSNENIRYFGAGKNNSDARKHISIENSEVKVAIVGCVLPETSPPRLATEILPGPQPFSLEDLKKQAVEIRETHDFIILFLHWGYELIPIPTKREIQLSNELMRHFDLIVGNHPHVVRGKLEEGSSSVYFSLGNTLFDDIRDETGNIWWRQTPQNLNGLLLRIEAIAGEPLKIEPISIIQEHNKIFLDPQGKAQKLLVEREIPLKLPIFLYDIYYFLAIGIFRLWTYRYEFRFRQLGVKASALFLVDKYLKQLNLK